MPLKLVSADGQPTENTPVITANPYKTKRAKRAKEKKLVTVRRDSSPLTLDERLCIVKALFNEEFRPLYETTSTPYNKIIDAAVSLGLDEGLRKRAHNFIRGLFRHTPPDFSVYDYLYHRTWPEEPVAKLAQFMNNTYTNRKFVWKGKPTTETCALCGHVLQS